MHKSSNPLVVVLWKWGSRYTAEHVNVLARALKLHLHIPYKVVCLTDDGKGLDRGIEVLPLPCETGKINTRRLWILSDEAKMLGKRLLQLDLDIVITGDITPLVARPDTFVVWKCEAIGRVGFALNPSVMLLDTGSKAFIWEKYVREGDELVTVANRAGCAASDQAVITYCLSTPISDQQRGRFVLTRKPVVPVWTLDDGIVNFRATMRHTPTNLPANTRIVSFHGPHDPAQYTHLPWVREHWSGLLDSNRTVNPVNHSLPVEVSHGAC